MVTSISIILSILIIISLCLLICISTYLTYLNPIYFLKICFLEDHANMFSKTYSLGISVKVVNNYSKWSWNYFRKASVYPWSRYSHFIRFMSTRFLKKLESKLVDRFLTFQNMSVCSACGPRLCVTHGWAQWNSFTSVLRRGFPFRKPQNEYCNYELESIHLDVGLMLFPHQILKSVVKTIVCFSLLSQWMMVFFKLAFPLACTTNAFFSKPFNLTNDGFVLPLVICKGGLCLLFYIDCALRSTRCSWSNDFRTFVFIPVLLFVLWCCV